MSDTVYSIPSQDHYIKALRFLILKRALRVPSATIEHYLQTIYKLDWHRFFPDLIEDEIMRAKYRRGLIHVAYHVLQMTAPQIATLLNLKRETVYYHLRQPAELQLNFLDIIQRALPSARYMSDNVKDYI